MSPDGCRCAPVGYPDAEELIPNVGEIIEPLTDLVRRARQSEGVDLVYVSNNYGDCTAQFSDIVGAALDAYVRHFPVVIPVDTVAHIDADLGAAALKMMEQNMSADITTAAQCLDK